MVECTRRYPTKGCTIPEKTVVDELKHERGHCTLLKGQDETAQAAPEVLSGLAAAGQCEQSLTMTVSASNCGAESVVACRTGHRCGSRRQFSKRWGLERELGRLRQR